MILEDKPSQQLYRTTLLHELWARTNLLSKAHPDFDTISPAGGCLASSSPKGSHSSQALYLGRDIIRIFSFSASFR
jgi:hypothetical protein